MPHKCARCNRIYEDNAEELLEGCSCGSRVFLYIRAKEDEKTHQEVIEELKKKNLAEDDLEWIEDRFSKELEGDEKTISLDVENLAQLDKGKYRLDLPSLMKGDPLVIKSKKGVYYIDIVHAMKKKNR